MTMPEHGLEAMSVFGFLAVGAIALFTMISISVWTDARRKEREAYYKADMLKKVAEEQGLKISGMVVGAVGVGLLIFLRALIPGAPIYLCGLLVFLIGAALFGGSYVVTVAE